jgi:hypothetical protein
MAAGRVFKNDLRFIRFSLSLIFTGELGALPGEKYKLGLFWLCLSAVSKRQNSHNHLCENTLHSLEPVQIGFVFSNWALSDALGYLSFRTIRLVQGF